MPTWSEIKAEVTAEQDLTEETWLTATELLNFGNDAVADIEKEIHTLHDKYFQTETTINLIQGVSNYDLPSDIYANKINGIYYNDGSEKYEIKEIKTLKDILDVDANDLYRYRVINTTASGTKLKLYPASRITNSSCVTLHYLRNAKRFALDSDELDIPEAKEFVIQYIKDRVSNKERMTLDAPESQALARKRKNLLDSLENMIDDDNNEVNIDLNYYGEFL